MSSLKHEGIPCNAPKHGFIAAALPCSFMGEGTEVSLMCLDPQVRWLWRFVMMPLLFGLVGASINLATIASGSIGKACAIVLAGLRPNPAEA